MTIPQRPGATTRRTVVEVVDSLDQARADTVVTEEPLEIRLSWPGAEPRRAAVTMRTPGADFELAAGFLLAEGVYDIGRPPRAVAYCRDRALKQQQLYNVVTVDLTGPPHRLPGRRTTTMPAACGVCGTESLDDIFTPDDVPVAVGRRLAPATVVALPDALGEVQPLFARTGSIHAAGIFDFDARLLVAREDVGRHNAVDKVVGARQLGTVAYGEEAILCASGRIGFDIVTKAVAARISTVVAVGGPSSLALELADRAGITVCGFTRGRRFVAYTHPERLSLP